MLQERYKKGSMDDQPLQEQECDKVKPSVE